MALLTACRDKHSDCTDGDYANCNTHYPEIGMIRVRLSVLPESPLVIVKAYEGSFETGKLLFTDSVRTLRYVDYYLQPEQDYSFTAAYTTTPYTTIAVDGGRIKRIRYKTCELTCYELREPNLDLRVD